jgi:hypothetical protein
MLKGLTPKFMSKFAGPFSMVEYVFKDVNKSKLPPKIKVHLNSVFYYSAIQGGYLMARVQASDLATTQTCG